MELSVVTSMYYSAPCLEEFYNRVKKSVEEITCDYEIIFVNDGSPDNSLDLAISFYKKDEKVKVIDLSRNFGHHKAMMTGLAHTKGDLVFLIDCDLEEEPELLETFYGKLKESNVDVVFGVQERRKGGLLEQLSGGWFFKLFNLLSSVKITPNIITVRLMTKRYVDSLIAHKDQEIFIAGLWEITGFTQMPLVVKKQSKGSSSYDFSKKLTIIANSVTSFSTKPLSLIFYIGLIITVISIIYIGYLLIRKLFFGMILAGWTSIIVSVWFLGGLIMFSLGIIGIYLSKVFMESKRRPYTIIREIYGKD